MFQQEVTLSNNIKECLKQVINTCPHDKIFVLADESTARFCLPLIQDQKFLDKAECLIIGATDTHKTLESLSYVWKELSDRGGTRHSLMLNIGGGMITDLGGFAASTFKRGITYINIPTTLLAMVDASLGGKTGINFNGLKNEIGVFNPAKTVLIDTDFLRTLDYQNLLSGYAEMLKHGLISTKKHWANLLNFNLGNIDYISLQALVAHSIGIKENIVKQDPLEQGIRKALNLGHTVGHAFESLALEENRPHLHGYAVAWGLVCELYLSHIKVGFPLDKMRQTIQFIRTTYGVFPFECKQYNRLYEFMTHDKKNISDTISFTLLSDIGNIHINQTATKKEIEEMLDFYRETMG